MADRTGRGPGVFGLKECALMAIATGRQAVTLRELREAVQTIPAGAIHYHFWGGRLRAGFDRPEYYNDFATWAFHALHDARTAERLAIVDPTWSGDLEALRQTLTEVLDECLYEHAVNVSAAPGQAFDFVTSQTLVFATGRGFATPGELAAAVPTLSRGSLYYHLIDARLRRADGGNDLTAWLDGFGPSVAPVVEALREVDPYFNSLGELRSQVEAACAPLLGGVR